MQALIHFDNFISICNQNHNDFLNKHFHHSQNSSLFPLPVHPHPASQTWASPDLFPVTRLEVFNECHQAVCILLCLASFCPAQCLWNSPLWLPVSLVYSLLFWIIVPCKDTPRFVYPVACWWTFACFQFGLLFSYINPKSNCIYYWYSFKKRLVVPLPHRLLTPSLSLPYGDSRGASSRGSD